MTATIDYDELVERVRTAAPRQGLIRMVAEPPAGDGRTLEGYFAKYGSRAEIDSWEGHFTEELAGGSLEKTVREQQGKLQMLFNHGFDPSIGKKPLGPITELRADETGGFVRARVSDTSYGNDILTLIADGAIDGMSFRMTIPKGKDDWQFPSRSQARSGALPHRTIREAQLDAELGPVTFPAYEATTLGVRSRADLEAWENAPAETRAKIRDLLRAGIPDLSALDGYDGRNSTPEPGAGSSANEPGSTHSTALTATQRAQARRARSRARGIEPHAEAVRDQGAA
jgi:hypothetical protein